MDQKVIENVKSTTEELLRKIKTEAEVVVETDNTGAVFIGISGEDLGVLIGYHGETLNAMQLVMSLILYKQTGNWQQVVVDVGDWRKKREEHLKNMALSVVNKVRQLQKPMALPYLSASERRVVHLYLSNETDIDSESQGEGLNRRLIIKPKQS